MSVERARLAVCLIVRNEAANLRRSLASVRGVADEVIVVDTGSTDDTVAVARSFGARIGRFPWRDDFAAARNAAFDLATAAWVLVMDADEELTFIRGETAIYQHIERTDPPTFARIRTYVKQGRWDAVGGTVIQPDTNLPDTETFCRHFTYGQRYFASRFGKPARVAWAADSFGSAGTAWGRCRNTPPASGAAPYCAGWYSW